MKSGSDGDGIEARGADVDPFMLHVYAALAEKERALISARTKSSCDGTGKMRLTKAETGRNLVPTYQCCASPRNTTGS